VPTSLDEHGHDTELARLLHARGLVDVPTLQRALEATRRDREKGGWTLARALVHHGVLSEHEMAARLGELGRRRSGDEPLRASLGSGTHASLAPPEPRLATDTLAGAAAAEGAAGWKKGMRIGDLRLVDMLGKGGMGIVYLAENVKTGARSAVKTIPENAPPELIERLKREGEAQASVDAHPNVVRVHALGSAFGRLYLVMDLVKGGTLEQRIRKGALPSAEAARIVRDLAQGLAFMHSKGVLHRDLKPSNVMFDEEGTPKLVDFGLALVGSATRLTMTGELLGTPAYMAPEQALAQRDRLGPWTDVYGLGGILYAALTGYSPYSGDTSVQVVEKLLKEPVVAPRARRAEIPPSLEAICLGALAKEPKDRPSPTALARSLDAWLEEASAPTTRPVSHLAKVLVGLALASVAGVALLVALPRRGAKAPLAPVAPVVTQASAPAPPPRVVPVSLVWKWPDALRIQITANLRIEREIPIPFAFVATRRFVFDLKPTGTTDEGRVSVSATLEAFEVHFRTEAEIPPNVEGQVREMVKPIDFDSEKPDDPENPFREAIGKSFTFDMDRTGAITAVKGSQALAWAVLQKVDEEKRMRFFIPEFSTEDSTKVVLDTLLHVVAEEGALPGGHWIVERHELPIVGRQMRERAPLNLSARVESKDESGGRASFKWSASGKVDGHERKLDGTASWQGGRIARSEQKDDVVSNDGRSHLVYELEELPAK
jgi:hypothetical protein